MKKQSILLIMEDNSNLKNFESSLKANAFDVIVANNGKTGFEKANEAEPDLILAATQLKKLDGIDLCYMIRQSTNLSCKPYILIGNNLNPEERINGFRSGVDAIIDTNISTRELCTVLETLIRRYELLSNQTIGIKHSLAGKLSNFSLIEILQLLNMNQKTGLLTIYNDKNKGEIAFKNGDLSWSQFGKKSGEESIQEMVFWEEGTFIFMDGFFHTEKNITKPTMQLILDCCQHLDETKENSD